MSEDHNAIRLARQAFAQTHEESDHSSMACVIATTSDCAIVRLCYQESKPPARAFYSVDSSGGVRELSFDEVRQYGELPWA